MQYEATTPSAYLAVLEEDWRKETLQEIRAILLAEELGLQETIAYKMLAYQIDQSIIFHLNAQKNYVSLYVGDTRKIDATGELLQGLNLGKGCIRFKKSNVVSDTQIKTFIERTVAQWKAGEDIGC